MIKPEYVNGQQIFRVYCDFCNKRSGATHEDPGEAALKAKKEKFVTIPGPASYDPMSWSCHQCANQTRKLA